MMDPLGKYLFVASTTGFIFSYVISAGGTLTPHSTPVTPTGSFCQGLAMTSSGSTLYVANYFSHNIEVFGVDAGGTLVSKGTVATGLCPIYPYLEPSGRFLYVANQRSNSVSLYTIDAARGVPSPVTSYFSGAGTWGAQSDTAGKYLYVTNYDDHSLHCYIINQVTGALTPNGVASGATSMATVKVLP